MAFVKVVNIKTGSESTIVLSLLPSESDQNAIHGSCDNCPVQLCYEDVDKKYKILKIACSWKCGKELSCFQIPTEPSQNLEKDAICSECGGLSKGQDYKHSENCSKFISIEKKVRDNCLKCGGPPNKRRGYQHTKNCPDLSVNKLIAAKMGRPEKFPCPHCNGPAARNGFTHLESCPNHSKNKLLKLKKQVADKQAQNTEVKPTCLKCNGPRKGRGYVHAAECPLNHKILMTEKIKNHKIKPPCPKCGGIAGRARGFRHIEDCPDLAKNKLAAKK